LILQGIKSEQPHKDISFHISFINNILDDRNSFFLEKFLKKTPKKFN